VRRAAILARAGAEAEQPWVHLPASLYRRYARDGDRHAFEGPYFHRRRRLGAAALAWSLNRDPILASAAADGVWALCEESTWCVPAHLGQHDQASGLPDPGKTAHIDLFNSESAQVLAECCQLAGPGISAIDPRILTRARTEILRRVVEPLLAGQRPWWFSGQNNWGPWCAANAIAAAGWVLEDRQADYDRLAGVLGEVVDRFVAGYGADGGCDEWVTYWSVSAGAMLRFREEVRLRSGAGEGWWVEPKIAAMLRFPMHMHLGDGWFPAFGDTVPRAWLWSGVLARAGELIGDAALVSFARNFDDPGRELDEAAGQRITGGLVTQQLSACSWHDGRTAPAAVTPGDVWLPDLQAMRVQGSGFAVAAKAGHNGENHNHNDVGQPVVHWRGRPVLVDAGRGEYTAQTFSAQRYDLWWTRGSGHAVPLIDGHEQSTGRQHAASGVAYASESGVASLGMDLSACYPLAGLGLRRRITLDRHAVVVTIQDTVRGASSYQLPLLFTLEPRPHPEGWQLDDLVLRCDAESVLERLDLSREPVMAASWPQGLWRLRLEATVPAAGRVITVTLRPRG
jgi:hypothetical protein